MGKTLLQFFILSLFFNIVSGQSIDAALLELQFSNDGYPEKFTEVENGFFFSSVDDQLWFSDGTVEKTSLVKDFDSGLYDDISFLTPVGKNVFFVAENGYDNRELWISDGTEEGTIQLTDRNVGTTTEGIYNIIEYNGKIYFGAYSEDFGNELWVSDGTSSGTFVFKDIAENTHSNPRDFFVFNEKLIFKADSEEFGTELWISDGTEEGTILLKDIRVGNLGGMSFSEGYITYGQNFYFFANNGTTGLELWKSDGTPGGTQLVKDINSGIYNSNNKILGAVINNELIFVANDGIHGNELWVTDGTSEGTLLFKDINPQVGSGIDFDGILQAVGNRIFFTATNGEEQSGLWVSDGTDSGTVFVSTAKPHMRMGTDTAHSFVVYFARNENNNNVLWKSDGTSNGTIILSADVEVTNISVSEQDFLSYGNYIFFNGKNEANGNELWVTDGTPEGTKLFFDVNHSSGVNPSSLTAVGDKLFFKGTKNGYFGLCTSDGTLEGTKYLNINLEGPSIHEGSEFINFNGKLIVSATDGIHGYELWISNGTQEGTFMIKDISPGSANSMLNSIYTKSFLIFKNKLYFHADDGSGRGLWVSNGTADGTYKITEPGITALVGANGTTAFTGFNNDIYFYGTNGSSRGLYKIDSGTNENTFIRHFGSIEHMAVANNKLFIIQDNLLSTYPEAAWELWASDGTSENTSFLMNFVDDDIDHVLTFKDELYFAARIKSDTGGSALFKSDGTIEGTIPIFTGKIPTSSFPNFKNLVVCGDYLYFGIENDSDSIIELWKTDGTVEGTNVVVNEIGMFNSITELSCFKNNMLFKQYAYPNKIGLTTGQSGEVYSLDVISNTKTELSTIYGLTVAENKLYFVGNNEVHGSEVYVTSVLNINSNGELADSDADGVVDLFDECPDTPVGEEINDVGCAQSQLDDDKDGVTNNLDQCPETLPNESVDSEGCSVADLTDSDDDGVNDTLDSCSDTPQGETVNSNGCSQSQLDDDEDGVMNDVDLCPGTFNYDVNTNGCPILFDLPSNNFTIETTGVTCVDKNNGRLSITAIEVYDYVANINGDLYTFTSELVIQNLYAGIYELCITISDNPDFKKCFNYEVADASEISGKSSTSRIKEKVSETIEISSGTPPYSVFINGNQTLTTMSSIFSVEVTNGDVVSVTSKFPCEGVFEKQVSVKGIINFAPNPTTDILIVHLPKSLDVPITIYNSNFQIVKSGLYNNENGILKVSLEDLPSGLYYLGLAIDEPVVLKVIKK